MKTKQILKGWKEVELRDICHITGGQPAPQDEKAFSENGIPFVRMQDLGRYHLTLNLIKTKDKISPSYNKKFSIIKKGSILIPRSGSVSLNHRAILGVDAYIVSHICALTLKDGSEVDNKFLYYVLRRFDMRKIMNKTTGLDAINFSDLSKIKLKFPPLNIQKQIVSILEKSEGLKQKREDADKLTKEYLQGVFYEMFGDPNSPNNKFEKIDFLDSIENEASNNSLKIKQSNFLEEGKYPIIDQGEEFIAGYTDDKSKVYSKKLPVVIFGDHTRVLKFVNFSFALGADGVKILVPNKEFNSLFFYYCLDLLDIKSAGYSRHYKFLKEKKIPLPPLPLQQKFAFIVEQVEKLKEKQKKGQEEIDNLFNSLMQKAFGREL